MLIIQPSRHHTKYMPQRELERLHAVNRFLKLNISKEKELQEIVESAAVVCGVQVAMITFMDDAKQYIKFKVGTDITEMNYQDTFCQHTLKQPQILEVPDVVEDDRFVNNPLTTAYHIRFYAGSTLTTHDGYNMGTLCLFDRSPKKLSSLQQQMLQSLSKQVIRLLEFDASLQLLKDQFIETRNTEIKLRSFFESTSSCHLLLDKNLEVLAFNKATSQFVAKTYQTELAIGMNVKDYMYPDHVPGFTANCQLALQGKPVRVERKFNYANETIWWAITCEPAFDLYGEIIGVSYNATNITINVEQEHRIKLQDESLYQIDYIQSHELLKPVKTIMELMDKVAQQNNSAEITEIALLKEAVKELDTKSRFVTDLKYAEAKQ